MAWPPPCTHTATPRSSAVFHTTSKLGSSRFLSRMCCGVTMPTMPSSPTQRRSSAAAAVVQRAAERDREIAVEPGPLLAGAAREHDGLIDALEVHVLEACLRVGHARALQAVQLRRPLRLL